MAIILTNQKKVMTVYLTHTTHGDQFGVVACRVPQNRRSIVAWRRDQGDVCVMLAVWLFIGATALTILAERMDVPTNSGQSFKP
jgi:hypothetical protein